MQSVTRATLIIGLVFLAALRTSAGPTQDRITILYDAFGKPSGMKKDWGYSALVEYGGKHILFDTGNNAEIFAQNVKVSGVDLKKLDFAVMSHRHGDHTGGMNYLLTVNPQVKIFAPKEGFGVFGASLPGTFYRQDASLPDYMRYYLACRATRRKVTTFEILAEKIELARSTFETACVVDTVELIQGDALHFLPRYRDIGFCFLDGEKEIYGQCYEVLVSRMVRGGMIVADNAIDHQATLRPMLDRALSDDRVDALIVPIGKGELICRKI